MFKKMRFSGEYDVVVLLEHKVEAIDALFEVALEKQEVRAAMSLKEDLVEAIDELVHFLIMTSGGVPEEEEEEDNPDLPRSKQPVGFVATTEGE